MGRRRIFSLLAAAFMAAVVALGLASGPASSTQHEQPDASCTFQEQGGAAADQQFTLAQRFMAQSTGTLTRVESRVYDSSNRGTLVVEIRAVDPSGTPTDTVLASASVPASEIPDANGFHAVNVAFALGAEVVAGQQYAVSFRGTEDSLFAVAVRSTDPCPGQQTYFSSPGASFAPSGTADLYFAAFVTPPDPEPRS